MSPASACGTTTRLAWTKPGASVAVGLVCCFFRIARRACAPVILRDEFLEAVERERFRLAEDDDLSLFLDDLLASRRQGTSDLGRDDLDAVLVGMDEIAGLYRDAADRHRLAIFEQMDVGVRNHDRRGEILKPGGAYLR